ncbi:MAG: extensin family protein [Alphaproteobacteria bacterium TMED89]|nr:hypothetical protein [Rhodospirillaceae bacterium]RPH09975.1 MAG: extensin family protein [Alphaproteobacteria bacterium TMED89]
MRILVSLFLLLAVLCTLFVLEVRRGTLAQLVDVLGDRFTPLRGPSTAPPLPDDGPECLERLSRIDGLQSKRLDAFFNDQGCGVAYPVLVQAIDGIDIEGRGLTLSCAAAERFSQWVSDEVTPLVRKHKKEPLVRIRHLGSYNCRKIGGSSVWSQHAFANAIDVAGLEFEDGSILTMTDHWESEPILKDLARTACDYFNVVLSPEYNALHHDHLHFDLGPYRTCR